MKLGGVGAVTLTVALATASGGPTAAEPPPLSAYAADRAVDDICVSPDGRTVAYTERRGAKKVLSLLPVGSGAPARGTAPVLLIDEEDTGRIEQSRRMRAALAGARRPVDLLVLTNPGQDLGTEAGRLALMQAMVDFLAKQNPA